MIALPPPEAPVADVCFTTQLTHDLASPAAVRHSTFWVEHPDLGRVSTNVWVEADTPWDEACAVGTSALEVKVRRLLEARQQHAHGSP